MSPYAYLAIPTFCIPSWSLSDKYNVPYNVRSGEAWKSRNWLISTTLASNVVNTCFCGVDRVMTEFIVWFVSFRCLPWEFNDELTCYSRFRTVWTVRVASRSSANSSNHTWTRNYLLERGVMVFVSRCPSVGWKTMCSSGRFGHFWPMAVSFWPYLEFPHLRNRMHKRELHITRDCSTLFCEAHSVIDDMKVVKDNNRMGGRGLLWLKPTDKCGGRVWMCANLPLFTNTQLSTLTLHNSVADGEKCGVVDLHIAHLWLQ